MFLVADLKAIADRLIAAYDGATTLPPITAGAPDFSVADGYAVLHDIEARRRAQGWQPVGRKIGFTNRTIWPRYGVYQPMWAHVWTPHRAFRGETARRRCRCMRFVQPRIEPEVVFKLKAPVPLTDDPVAVLASVEWIAPGFEIVQSHFPDWKFTAADCTAAFGLHGALVVGAPVAVTDANRARLGGGAAGVRGDAVARRCRDRPRHRRECAGQPGAGARPSRPAAGRAAASPAARRGRDRHHRHDHRRLAGRGRRDLVVGLRHARASMA